MSRKQNRSRVSKNSRQMGLIKAQDQEIRNEYRNFVNSQNSGYTNTNAYDDDEEDEMVDPYYVYNTFGNVSKGSSDLLTIVPDTNVLIDYPDIIPKISDEGWHTPKGSTINFDDRHVLIIITDPVIQELDRKKNDEDGWVARQAIKVSKRIRKIADIIQYTPGEVAHINQAISVPGTNIQVAIFKMHKSFTKSIDYHFDPSDMDAQIMMTAACARNALNNMPIDGEPLTRQQQLVVQNTNFKVLSNDNNFGTRSYLFGIKTTKYSYELPEPYTGRRDIVVPTGLFNQFVSDPINGVISIDTWNEVMKNKGPKLVANEFIVMTPSDQFSVEQNYHNNPKFSNIGRYDARARKIVHLLYLDYVSFTIQNAGQAMYAEALANPDIKGVICFGPAGTGKTYDAVTYGREAVKNGEYTAISVIPVEVHNDGVGFLPGNLEQKMQPKVQPIIYAFRSWLLKHDKKFTERWANIQKFGIEAESKKGQQQIEILEELEKPEEERIRPTTQRSKTDVRNEIREIDREISALERERKTTLRPICEADGAPNDPESEENVKHRAEIEIKVNELEEVRSNLQVMLASYIFPEDIKRAKNLGKKGVRSKAKKARSAKGQSTKATVKHPNFENDLLEEANNMYRESCITNPISYSRGLTLTHQLMFFDEIQDNTPNQVDMLVNRTGVGSKPVLTGDIAQIHFSSSRLTPFNNGLRYIREKHLDDPDWAQVYLKKDEVVRSDLNRNNIGSGEERAYREGRVEYPEYRD